MQTLIRSLFLAITLCSSALAADAPGYVSQARFDKLVAISREMYKRLGELEKSRGQSTPNAGGAATPAPADASIAELRERLTRLEKELSAARSTAPLNPGGPAPVPGSAVPAGEEDIDLAQMDEVPANPPNPHGGATPSGGNPHGGGGANPHAAGLVAPMFKTYFDLNLYALPGGPAPGSGFTFDNFHSFVMLDIIPTPDIQFSADVSPTPRFYELAYRIAPPVTLRFGKIWVPFDDINPHHIYGGRINVSRLTAGGSNFLPDIFTDLGIGVDWKAIETASVTLDVKAYAVNGFRASGNDPITAGSPYPAFGPEQPLGADNNKDKALGGRVHLLLWQTWGLGASYYTGRWTDQDQDPRRLTMLGGDAQGNFGPTTVRVGFAQMKVSLPATAVKDSYGRGANYVEIAHRMGENRRWRLTGRAGSQNLDDRSIDRNDRQIAGLQLAFRPSMVEFSVEFSRDLKKIVEKSNYNFTNFRVVAAF